MKKWFFAALILLTLVGMRDWNRRAIEHEPGILVAETPVQVDLPAGEIFSYKAFQLTKRAVFNIRARVLSTEDYYWGADAELSPIDLALGWGVMSDQAVLDRIDISQGSRWYHTRYQAPAPVSDHAIINHSGNMHIIPANKLVSAQLKKLRRGHVILASGLLVDIDHENGFRWRTSLRRSDTGGGSCEIFYLERLIIEAPD
jgi:hypothetical protein